MPTSRATRSPPLGAEASARQRALVIVPTYNERENIARLIETVLSQDRRLEVLVVDDGSPDGTASIVEEIMSQNDRVHILSRPRKMGLGHGVRGGLSLGARARLRLGLRDGRRLLPRSRRTFQTSCGRLSRADLVLGSRYRDGKVTVVNWPISRLILSYFANVYARAVTGLPVWDATGGFKCFRRSVLQSIDLGKVRSNGYAFQIEMSFRAWKRGFKIVEIPIVFVDRTEGQSKMSKSIVREAVWMVWRLRWLGIANRA